MFFYLLQYLICLSSLLDRDFVFQGEFSFKVGNICVDTHYNFFVIDIK